jgi:hypothetical protein
VNHPAHYGGEDNPYETIKVLKAKLTPEEFRGFCVGNALKYIVRAPDKGGDQDLQKAVWYLMVAAGHDSDQLFVSRPKKPHWEECK